MNKTRRISPLLALVPLVALGLAATTLEHGVAQEGRANAAGPARSTVRTGPVRGLVFARPFTVTEPFVHHWRLEQPQVHAGWLLVLEVDPLFVEPRQMAMPVLLVGDQTVECVNFGHESGRVISIVPAPADESGMPLLELAASPAWFAAPELPERVDAAWIASELARARPENVATFTAEEIAAALGRAGTPLRAQSRVELERQAALLILEHSPEEHEQAEGLLVPMIK